MREALPNAFLFGLTGTPINRADRNTFYAFGAEEDTAGYLSRYGFPQPPARFDVVAVVWPTGQPPIIRHTTDALGATF